MILPYVLAFVGVQRLAELVYAERNTRRLLARGGAEYARWQHPWFVALHAAWLIGLAVFVPWTAAVNWPLLVCFALLQLARVWVIASLGPYWTTRLIALPGAPLVRQGPYRFMRHPNYAIVAAEIAVLPLAFGAWEIAAIFTVLNAALLACRMRPENGSLDARDCGGV